MWHDIFYLDVTVLEKLIRPVLIYAFLAIALRLAGKRELAQLNSLDFVVLLAVANRDAMRFMDLSRQIEELTASVASRPGVRRSRTGEARSRRSSPPACARRARATRP